MGNFTSIELIANLLETNIFGSTALLGLFTVMFFVIILLVARSFAEVALMIPFPLIITLSEAAIIPTWVKPLVYMIAGFYLAIIILIITGLVRK
ncbi:hypothetical protein LCGC14_1011570 [marine sediment metagenome]|uniref:TRAP C4-dicarboxylate transport system permease DctM subunit domain-containing protein n=1 Tax=marine sediment metagenome TaxID=412755 RepID=A0A0F9NLI6_9ZZZZ